MKKIGFSIIGRPNVIGSDIPKNAGMIPTLPTTFKSFDLEKHRIIASERQEPTPPMQMKYTQKASVNIAVGAIPAASCAAFSEMFIIIIGPISPQKVALWIPKNHAALIIKVIRRINHKLSVALICGAITELSHMAKVVSMLWKMINITRNNDMIRIAMDKEAKVSDRDAGTLSGSLMRPKFFDLRNL